MTAIFRPLTADLYADLPPAILRAIIGAAKRTRSKDGKRLAQRYARRARELLANHQREL